jgi:hypothetical protein
MATPRYLAMKTRAQKLKRLFAPKTQNPLGRYTQDAKEKLYSFSVLAHATIEEYIENEVKIIGDSALQRWNVNQYVCLPLLAMMCRREGDNIGFSGDVFTVSPQKDLRTVVATTHVQLNNRIGGNHGVRKANVAKLFMSVGFVPSGQCEAVLNSLDAFGSKRGEYAHKIPTATPLQQTDPFVEASETIRLIDELEDVDDELSAFRTLHGL